MNTEQARTNMIKQQIKTCEVTDERLIELLQSVRREDFVPPQYCSMAFADTVIPLAQGQQMYTPREEARLLQELALQDSDSVLEIGTGTGYLTALLANLSRQVLSVDIIPEFTTHARHKLAQQQIENVNLVTADAAIGWHDSAPYDVIVISAALPFLPDKIKQDLKIGGRIFAIIGTAQQMTAWIVKRNSENDWEKISLFETVTPVMINAPQVEKFTF